MKFWRKSKTEHRSNGLSEEQLQKADQARELRVATYLRREQLFKRPSVRSEVRYTCSASTLAEIDAEAVAYPAELFGDDPYTVEIVTVRPVEGFSVWEADCIAKLDVPKFDRHTPDNPFTLR